METERNFFILQRCGPGEAADFDLACANVLRCLRSASARFLASLRWRSHHSQSFFGWANLLFPLAIIGSTHGVVDAAAAVAGPGTAVTPDELLLAAAAKVATLTDKASTVLLSTWFWLSKPCIWWLIRSIVPGAAAVASGSRPPLIDGGHVIDDGGNVSLISVGAGIGISNVGSEPLLRPGALAGPAGFAASEWPDSNSVCSPTTVRLSSGTTVTNDRQVVIRHHCGRIKLSSLLLTKDRLVVISCCHHAVRGLDLVY